MFGKVDEMSGTHLPHSSLCRAIAHPSPKGSNPLHTRRALLRRSFTVGAVQSTTRHARHSKFLRFHFLYAQIVDDVNEYRKRLLTRTHADENKIFDDDARASLPSY